MGKIPWICNNHRRDLYCNMAGPKKGALMEHYSLDAKKMALPRNTSTKPNLESTKLAEFTPKERCVLKPEPNTLQSMISGF